MTGGANWNLSAADKELSWYETGPLRALEEELNRHGYDVEALKRRFGAAVARDRGRRHRAALARHVVAATLFTIGLIQIALHLGVWSILPANPPLRSFVAVERFTPPKDPESIAYDRPRFVLRLYFSGLMAFVPKQEGTELTVLLLNSEHQMLSDGSALAHHKPLLLARAGNCIGDCPKRDAAIARHLFGDQTETTALDSLEAAIAGGGAWVLSNSELSIHKGSANDPDLAALDIRQNVRDGIIPTSAAEREDFRWVADLRQIAPTSYTLNPDLLASPPPGLIAARLTLHSGKVFTYRIARIGSNVMPVHFQRLDGTGGASPYSQAVATWVGAEIEVSSDNVQIVEEKFGAGIRRSMTLSPNANGEVEIAVINLPPLMPPETRLTSTPAPDKHFEAYYDLAATPPTQSERLVPNPDVDSGVPEYPEVSWDSIHSQSELWSDLLNAIRLNIGSTASDPF